jgi:hypothetical protein
MPIISGTVFDASGNPVAGRIVRAYRRDTGELLAETLSSDGSSSSDPHWDKVVALLHFDGDFTDETGGVVTTGGALSFTTGKFGEAVRFTRSPTPRTLIRKTGLNIGSGDFTIEAWVRLSSTSLNNTIFDFRLGAGGSTLPLVESDGGNLYVWVNNSYLIGPVTSALSASNFKHLALVRSSGVMSLWLDGVLVGTAEYTYDMGNAQVSIGRSMNTSTTNYDLAGDIDELRITKGVARYTENFTPPTEPFPNTSTLLPLGKYVIETTYTGECFVVCFPNENENTNAKIWDKVVPLEI